MLRCVAVVRTDVSEERIACLIRVTTIGELVVTSNRSTLLIYLVLLRRVRRLLFTTNVVPSSPIIVTLLMETIHFSEASVLNKSHAA
jgi:hypothetical protein